MAGSIDENTQRFAASGGTPIFSLFGSIIINSSKQKRKKGDPAFCRIPFCNRFGQAVSLLTRSGMSASSFV